MKLQGEELLNNFHQPSVLIKDNMEINEIQDLVYLFNA